MYQKKFFQLILILLILQFSNSSIFAKTVIDCEYLAAVAEEKKDLPAGLLSSISNVEAGRVIGNNPKRGWPWTVNHAGEGLFFENKSEAIQYVKRYLKLGDVNMDVGCMQISLKWHSDNFSTLEEAFDPVININYAADFLKKLFSIHKDWNLAIKHYHSSDPKKNIKYHQKVLAAWKGSEFSNDKESFIKAHLTLPIAKPEYRKNNNSINLSKSTKVSKKITQKQNIKNNNITENIKSVSNTHSKPKFIQDRWDIVLKFRKEFQNK